MRQVAIGRIVLSFALSLAVSLAIATSASAAELRIGVGEALSSWDVREVRDAGTAKALGNVYDTLVAYAPGSTRLEPGLALSWSTAKRFSEWTFKLRPNVVFSDGTPALASVVAESLAKVPLLVERADVLADDRAGAITVRLRGADAELPSFFAQAFTGIVLERDGALFGTGPFMIAPGATLEAPVLQPNPRYWGPRPKLDRVVLKPYRSTDGTSDVFARALAAGEIDMVDGFLPWEIEKFESIPGIVVKTVTSRGLTMLGMNNERPPFDDIRVRRAVALALDRDALVRALFPAGTETARAPLPPTIQAARPDPWRHDPEAAKKLLAEAGHADGIAVMLLDPFSIGSANGAQGRMSQMIEADLERVGFRVRREIPKNFEAFVDRIGKGDWQLAVQRWIADTGSAADFLASNLASDQVGLCPSCNNAWRFRNDQVDAAIRELRSTKSREAFDAIVDAFHREAPFVPLVYGPEVAAWNAKVKGFAVSPTPSAPLARVEIAAGEAR